MNLHFLIDTRNNIPKLKNPIRKTNMGQKTISYAGPSIWNSLSNSIKKANNLNTFKHNVWKHYLTWMINDVHVCMCIYIYICLCVRGGVYINVSVYNSVVFLLLIHSHVFFPHLLFPLIFVLIWETTMKIRRFCPFSAILAIVDAIRICLQ